MGSEVRLSCIVGRDSVALDSEVRILVLKLEAANPSTKGFEVCTVCVKAGRASAWAGKACSTSLYLVLQACSTDSY